MPFNVVFCHQGMARTISESDGEKLMLWMLEAYNTESPGLGVIDVRYRSYTTSQKRADAFERIPKIQFTDSGHGIVFHAISVKSRRLPEIMTLRDYVRKHMK